MEDIIASVRAFNRFYTRFVGALEAGFLGTEASLIEARLLFEIGHREAPVATDLQAALAMDAGYLSRMLGRLAERGWLVRERGQADARRRPLRLTQEGQEILAVIDARQRERIASALSALAPVQQADLSAALGMARLLLDPPAAPAVTIRPFRTGDLPMIAARQSLLYAQENGWGRGLEANEAQTIANFLQGFKPGREQCWIAELDGVMAGSVLLTDENEGLARLRLLYVEPFARGHGLGTRLVATCVGFARDLGYVAMTLWTHTVLESARRIYAAQGFSIVAAGEHEAFGVPVMGETWRLVLGSKEAVLF